MSKPESFPHLPRALETIAEAESASTVSDLNTVFLPAFERLGFSLFAGIEIANPRTHLKSNVRFGFGFEAWWAHYERMGYATEDPMTKECIRSWDSFFWSEVVVRRELTLKELLVLSDARSFELHDGFVSPHHKTDGSIFAVLLAGKNCSNTDIYTRATANILCSYYGVLGRRLYYGSKQNRPATDTLTERQIECLMWARQGKSSKDIGDILGISEDVVDQHISKACKRLRVRTRMQAVIAAIVKGYFD